MEVLDYSPEAARAYFATETRKALEAVEQAASGVALRDVSRVLKLFAEGLSGKTLTILSQGQEKSEASSSQISSEGVIVLPARVRQYATREDNLRLYKLMTAHEAGHFEYGTYDLDLGRIGDLSAQACLRYGRQARAQAHAFATPEQLLRAEFETAKSAGQARQRCARRALVAKHDDRAQFRAVVRGEWRSAKG